MAREGFQDEAPDPPVDGFIRLGDQIDRAVVLEADRVRAAEILPDQRSGLTQSQE